MHFPCSPEHPDSCSEEESFARENFGSVMDKLKEDMLELIEKYRQGLRK